MLSSWLHPLPLVAILRGISPDEAVSIGHVLADAGFRVLEVPLNSPQPMESIRRLSRSLGDRYLIGASPVPLWRIDRDSQPLLQPGDQVRFDPVSLREYEHWLSIARSPDFQIHAIHEPHEAAA